MNDLHHEVDGMTQAPILEGVSHLDLIQETEEAMHDPVDLTRLAALHRRLLSRHVTLNTTMRGSGNYSSREQRKLWQEGLDTLLAADVLILSTV